MRKARGRSGGGAGSRKPTGGRSEIRQRSKAKQAATAESVGPTDEELFATFAEFGMKPGDFVAAMAKRYAAYLEQQQKSRRKRRGPDIAARKR